MTRYLIIGSGRAATHFSFYFQSLGISFSSWNRKQSLDDLHAKASTATHVLLLISDSALETFYQEHLQGLGKTVIHFSGALEIDGMISAHPLMSFSEKLYSLEFYWQIPFVTTSSRNFSEILPGLTNPHFKIKPEQKALYHALCVMSGNFTTMLWQKMQAGLESLQLPAHVADLYLRKITENILDDSKGALTGPLARKDLTTILKNDRALKADPYQKIYRAFAETYYPESLTEILKADV